MDFLPSTVAPLEVLTAMITPAVLISACGTLILSTSQRLGRVVTRVRDLSKQVESLAAQPTKDDLLHRKITVIFDQIGRQSRRARLLQKGLTAFYVAVGVFVVTSFAIGISGATGLSRFPWIPAALGVFGLLFLCYGSGVLIVEANLALRTIHREMDFTVEISRLFVPAEILEKAAKQVEENRPA